jgi:hypothetical protein
MVQAEQTATVFTWVYLRFMRLRSNWLTLVLVLHIVGYDWVPIVALRNTHSKYSSFSGTTLMMRLESTPSVLDFMPLLYGGHRPETTPWNLSVYTRPLYQTDHLVLGPEGHASLLPSSFNDQLLILLRAGPNITSHIMSTQR